MNWKVFLIALETFVFWALVILIAIRGRDAPTWAFALLFYYVIYLGLRFAFSFQGTDRMIYLNIINLVVLLGLFVWFYTH